MYFTGGLGLNAGPSAMGIPVVVWPAHRRREDRRELNKALVCCSSVPNAAYSVGSKSLQLHR